jgi:CRP/FNR family transcriptional regulator, cyclic AMP receptor protein
VLERESIGSGSLLRMPIDASILSEIEHLSELSTDDRAALAEKIDLMRYGAGQSIFNMGDPGHALYIVRSGEVEIYLKNDQGEKIVLETARPGDIFGEVSLLDDGPRTAWVMAIRDVEVLRLDRAHFEDYVRQHTPAALNLLSVAARRLRKSDEFIRHTITRNVNDVAEEQQTSVTRIADAVPAMVGTLPSTMLHALVFAGWIAINLGVAGGLRRFDPYPFGLLSVIISLEAIFLTLFVLTSQNRQRSRDRIRSDIEFETSINTEVKIARLHEKVDKLTEEHYEVLENTRKLLAGGGRL